MSATALDSECFQKLEALLSVSGDVLSDLASDERFGEVLEKVANYTTQAEAQLDEYRKTLQYGEQLGSEPSATGAAGWSVSVYILGCTSACYSIIKFSVVMRINKSTCI